MDDTYLFVLTLVGLVLGFTGGLVVYFLRSKCNSVSCCFGLLEITRDIESELKEELNEMDHGINPFKFEPSHNDSKV